MIYSTTFNRVTGQRWAIQAAIVLAVALISGSGCKKKAPDAKAPQTTTTAVIELGSRDIAEATLRALPGGVRFTGTLNPGDQVEVKAQTMGQLDMLHVGRGTIVTQGQVLAVLDDRGAKAMVESQRSQVAAAEREFRSAELLFKAGAGSERNVVNSKVALEGAKAQLTQLEQSVDRGIVKSPINGVISDRAVSSGEAVGPGQRLFMVVNTEALECAASVLPADSMHVKVGQKALLTVHQKEFEGRVDRIDPIADPKSRRVGIYIRIPNPERTMVAGLFANGVVLTNAAARELKVLTIPASAVQEESGVQVVYALENGRLARKAVEIDRHGVGEEGLVEVKSGLAPGAKVVLSASEGLKDGTQVKVAVQPPAG